MISERYAVAPRSIAAPRGAVVPRVRLAPRGRRPAIAVPWTRLGAWAVRDRLTGVLGNSVLVQLMLAVAFLACAGLLYMAQQSQVSVQEINISVLRSERMQLMADNVSLRQTATNLSSIQRVDAIATSQLHMTKPDPAMSVWVSPVVPRIAPIPAVDADVLAAQRASQPLAWLQHALHVVQTSL